MDVKLQQLNIFYFKGITSFRFTTEGHSAAIIGRNGAGKTSVADAMNWLLFGKNALGATEFGLKPLDDNGQEMHYREHEVSAVLTVDDREITLRKVMTEKWTKKRGASAPEFTGHETAYSVDGVPKNKTQYDKLVSDIVPEKTFRLLTSVSYFNEALTWQDRRALLLEIAGDVSDADVIAKNPHLKPLLDIPNGRSLEDHRKVLDAQRRTLNDELKTLPARIDEALLGKPAETACFPPYIEPYGALNRKLAELQAKKGAVLAGDTTELQQKIVNLRSEISRIDQAYQASRIDVMRKRGEAEEANRRLESKIQQLAQAAASKRSEICDITSKMAQLRAEWATEKAMTEPSSICSLCGQPLPKDQAEEIIKKFRAAKADTLKMISDTGKGLASKVEALNREGEALDDEKANLEATPKVPVPDYPDAPDVTSLQAQIAELSQTMSAQETPDTAKIDAEIEKVQSLIKLHDDAAANRKIANRQDARVMELKAEQKKYGAELDAVDAQIRLCDEFVKAKINMMESAVSDVFAPLSFRLFKQQINGGIADCCETMMYNRPYSTLSTGEKIVAGMVIIAALSRHYGITAPVFVDNAESVTLPLPSITQTIRLVAKAIKPEQETSWQRSGECLLVEIEKEAKAQ